jgi:hypothetical protein
MGNTSVLKVAIERTSIGPIVLKHLDTHSELAGWDPCIDFG